MKFVMLSVLDLKARAFIPPFCVTNVAVGARVFAQNVNMQDSAISKNPEDYNLYYLGTWDDETALFQPLDAPELVATAMSFKKPDFSYVNQIPDRNQPEQK